MFYVGISVIAFGSILFYLGGRYGRIVEQEVVAKALADYSRISATATGEAEKILGFLKTEYTKAYDEIKRAL